jgi:nitrite reductase (NADH) large subunit
MLMANSWIRWAAAVTSQIESMGVRVHTSKNTKEIVQEDTEARKTMRFADGSELEVDFIVFSTGIRPRDKLATQCGLKSPTRRYRN